MVSKKRDSSQRRKIPVNTLPSLKKGTKGTMEEYRNNVAEFMRMVRNRERKRSLSIMQRMDEIRESNKMLSTLYDMQEKFERKIKIVEGDETHEDETVEIKKGEVTVTVPKKPEEQEDPESLAHSPEFGGMLAEMPVSIVEKKYVPTTAEPNPALKEIFS